MIAEQDARKLLPVLVEKLRKKYGDPPEPPTENLLEEAVRLLLAEKRSQRAVQSALRALREEFVDWNEVRVSTVYEVAACIGDSEEAVELARSVRSLLRVLFDAQNEVSADWLPEASPAEARELFDHIPHVPTAVGHRMLLEVFGHACVPITADVARVCMRLDLTREDYDAEQVQKRLERVLAKALMPAFYHLVAAHASQTCTEQAPKCRQCPIRKECPYPDKTRSE